MNFLELENKMMLEQKQKLASACPSGIGDLSKVKIIPKDKYKTLKSGFILYLKFMKEQKQSEMQNMLLNDSYTLNMYKRKLKGIEKTLEQENGDSNKICTKDAVEENQKLKEIIKQLEEKCVLEEQK